MKIRPLAQRDREKLYSMLIDTQGFTAEEIEVAMGLIDIVLKDSNQEDYKIHCMANHEDQAIGHICYGPVPMTQGTFDLHVRHGFQEVARVPDYYHAGNDRITFCKRIL